MKITSTLVTLAVIVLVSIGSPAQQLKLSDPIPKPSDLKTGKLPNGITYYIRKNTETYMNIHLAVNAGSVQEDDSQQGLAHLIQHLAFGGSKHFSRNEVTAFLTELGVPTEPDKNANTTFDETVYRMSLRSDNNEHIEKAFTLLEDIAGGLSFNAEEIERERAVVLQELPVRNNTTDRNSKIVFPKYFAGSKYAMRLTGGTENVLRTFKPEDVKRFYTDWYRPDLMAVVVAGNINPDEIETLIKQHFGNLKAGKKRDRVTPSIPPLAKTEAIVIPGGETSTALRVIFPLRKIREITTAGDYRERIVTKLFESMLNNRLMEIPKRPNPPFPVALYLPAEQVRGFESPTFQIVIGRDGVAPAVAAFMQELDQIRKTGFTANEFDAARKSLLQRSENDHTYIGRNWSDRLTVEMGRNFLAGEPITDSEKKYEMQQAFLNQITLQETNTIAQKYFPADAKKVVVLTTIDRPAFPIPTNEQLLSWIENPSAIDLRPKEAIATAPVAGKILSTRHVKEGDYTELKLENGATVLVKAGQFKRAPLAIFGFRPGGLSLYNGNDQITAKHAAGAVIQMGFGKLSHFDMMKIAEQKQTYVNPKIDATSDGIVGISMKAELETLLQLVNVCFSEPKRDEAEFKAYVSDKQNGRAETAETLFQDSVLSIVYNNYPPAEKFGTGKKIAAINLDRSIAVYKERFSNVAGYTFVLLGSFDPAKASELVATYIASLPGGTPPAFKNTGFRPVKGPLKKEIKIANAQESIISLRFVSESPYSDVESLRFRALQDILKSRFEQREELFAFSLYGKMSKIPYEGYQLDGAMHCAPEEIEKYTKLILDEIAKLKSAGPTEEELSAGKTKWRGWHQSSLKEADDWAKELQRSIENKSSLDTWLNFDKYIDALTTKDLKDAANKYLDLKNLKQVVMKPQ